MSIDSEKDLTGLMKIGRIVAMAMRHMQEQMEPGMTTAELDAIGADFLKQHGARSAPILAYQFPGHTCISINDEAAHGIPGPRVIQEGDLVNIDVSAELDGYWADTGATTPVPPITAEQQQLCDHTKLALERATSIMERSSMLVFITWDLCALSAAIFFSRVSEMSTNICGSKFWVVGPS